MTASFEHIPNRGPFRILSVEDNSTDARLILALLRENNPNVHLTHLADGELAMKALQQYMDPLSTEAPDLILLDLNLPKVSGFEILKFIKTEPSLRSIPTVILTSSNHRNDIVRCYDSCANSYMTKPNDYLEFEELMRSISSHWLVKSNLPTRV